MATYNGARFIEAQLASFTKQRVLPAGLVVTDDGSSDKTLAIVERFAESAPFPVRIERNRTRLGYTRNFERAISLCTGEIVLISDQDDAWFADKISTILEHMAAASGRAIMVNDQVIVRGNGKSSGATMFGNFRRAGCPDTDLIAGSCTAIPRIYLPLLLPFPDGVPYDSWIGAFADGLGIKQLIEQPLQIYRRHSSNATEPVVASERATRWSAFQRYGMADPRPSWSVEIGWRSELLQRLIERAAEIDALIGEPRALAAAEATRQRIAMLQQRSALLDKPRWQRFLSVIAEWQRGLYSGFLGPKSAIKDILRP